MISDILSDAVRDIQEFQADFPDLYKGASIAIDKVTTVMTALMRLLDSPWLENYPEYNSALERFWAEIEAVEVGGLLKAFDDLMANNPYLDWPRTPPPMAE